MKMREFTDERGNVFEVKEKLGSGTQGVVYKTTDADIAVKLLLENSEEIKDPDIIKFLQRNIKRIIYKPIPEDLPVARPLSVLKNEAGYVMYLLEDMQPLSKLFAQKLSKEEKIEIPFFLEEYAKNDLQGAEYIAHYAKTGSLRLRTKLLSRLASTLHRLHCRGMLYGDISYNNIFFNNDGIFLIDTDNIEYSHLSKSRIYTPEFEVPEVMKGDTNSIYSDIYAYAILAYYLLTIVHPFDGAMLDNDWDNESKEIWEVPWIEDSNDPSNESNKVSLRGPLTITPELDALFHKVFEEGKKDKYKRPSTALWCEAFEKAYSQTLKCPKCSMTYYDTMDLCPYCDEKKPKRVVAESFYPNGLKRWEFAREISKKTTLKNYIFKPFEISDPQSVFLEIIPHGEDYRLVFKTTDKIFLNKRVLTTSIRIITKEEMERGIEISIKNPVEINVKIRIVE